MEKANDDDKKETPSVTYSKTELKKAVSIVNAEVQRLTCQIEQFLEEKRPKLIVIKGFTTTGFPAEISVSPMVIEEVVSDFYLMNYVLKSEFPRDMWLKILELVGLYSIEYLDFPFPLGPDGVKKFYVALNEN